MDRQAIGVDDRVNLARQPALPTAHILMGIVRDTGPVLVYAHNGGIDHLYRRIVTSGQRIHDPVPYSPTPTNEAIVAGRAGTVDLRQIAPRRTRTQDPKDAVEHATVIYTW